MLAWIGVTGREVGTTTFLAVIFGEPLNKELTLVFIKAFRAVLIL
jgi:hypothetical protein